MRHLATENFTLAFTPKNFLMILTKGYIYVFTSAPNNNNYKNNNNNIIITTLLVLKEPEEVGLYTMIIINTTYQMLYLLHGVEK